MCALVLVAAGVVTYIVHNAGDHAAGAGGVDSRSTSDVSRQAVAPPASRVTAASTEAATAAALSRPFTAAVVARHGTQLLSRETIIDPGAAGVASDTYYDGSGTPISRSGLTASGHPIYIDYPNKTYYTTATGGLTTISLSWIMSGLADNRLVLSGNRITGKDQIGSPVTIELDASTHAPSVITRQEPAGTVTETFTWTTTAAGKSDAASTAASSTIKKSAIVTPPAGFKHSSTPPPDTSSGPARG